MSCRRKLKNWTDSKRGLWLRFTFATDRPAIKYVLNMSEIRDHTLCARTRRRLERSPTCGSSETLHSDGARVARRTRITSKPCGAGLTSRTSGTWSGVTTKKPNGLFYIRRNRHSISNIIHRELINYKFLFTIKTTNDAIWNKRDIASDTTAPFAQTYDACRTPQTRVSRAARISHRTGCAGVAHLTGVSGGTRNTGAAAEAARSRSARPSHPSGWTRPADDALDSRWANLPRSARTASCSCCSWSHQRESVL